METHFFFLADFFLGLATGFAFDFAFAALAEAAFFFPNALSQFDENLTEGPLRTIGPLITILAPCEE